MYPHVHLIPRRKGDMKDPRGGVRHVIPEKGNYRKSESPRYRFTVEEIIEAMDNILKRKK